MRVVKSVVKSSQVLELFSGTNESLGLSEIAQSLKMNKATASHIVSTLVMQGFLKQKKKRGKYFLGAKLLNLGANLKRNSEKRFRTISYLTELSGLINEIVNISVWSGSNILFSRATDFDNISFNKTPMEWKSIPLHSLAMGKLVLSCMSEEDLNKYFHSKALEKITPKTIIDIDQMKEQLRLIRRESIAFDLEESGPDINSIAVGMRDSDGEIIGAIVITGHSKRLTREILDKITPTVKLYALKISRELGYRG